MAENEEVTAETPLRAEAQELLTRLQGELGADIVEHANALGDLVVRVKPSAWHKAAEVAKTKSDCDFLSFISGIDWKPAPKEGDETSADTSSPVQPDEMTFGAAGSAGRFQVFAHVESTSIPRRAVTFKTDIDEKDPKIQSWVDVYPGADWHERECWEMYGIAFDGHPGLRHLYLPVEFEGYPCVKMSSCFARVVKPWPGIVDVEPMPGEENAEADQGGDA